MTTGLIAYMFCSKSKQASNQQTITASVYTKHTRIQTRWPPTLLHSIGLKKKAESPFLVQCTFKTETKRSRVIDVSNVKRIRNIQVFVRLSCFCAIQPFSLVSVLQLKRFLLPFQFSFSIRLPQINHFSLAFVVILCVSISS